MLDAEVWYMIREMRDRGMAISEIARQLSMSRNTVKRHLGLNRPMEYERKKRSSKLDPVRPIIRELIDKYNLSAVRIMEEVRKWGYQGSYTILKEYCRTLRKERSIKAVYRFETEPGRQGQVDLGSFGVMDVDGVRRWISLLQNGCEETYRDRARDIFELTHLPCVCLCVF